jgi:NifB/MoaA-like Fe-S oxidoreductase
MDQDLGDQLLLPSVMLRQGDPVFLDDMTLDQITGNFAGSDPNRAWSS